MTQGHPQTGWLPSHRRRPDGIGARQGLSPVGRCTGGGRPRGLRSAAGRSLDQPRRRSRHHRGAPGLAGQTVDAFAGEVGGLHREHRVGLGLGPRRGGVEHPDAGEEVAREAGEVGLRLTGADPDVVGRGIVEAGGGGAEVDPQASRRQRTRALLRGHRVGGAPAAQRAPRGAAVIGVPDPARGRGGVGPPPVDRFHPHVVYAPVTRGWPTAWPPSTVIGPIGAHRSVDADGAGAILARWASRVPALGLEQLTTLVQTPVGVVGPAPRLIVAPPAPPPARPVVRAHAWPSVPGMTRM